MCISTAKNTTITLYLLCELNVTTPAGSLWYRIGYRFLAPGIIHPSGAGFFFRFMVYNATFNNISVTYIVAVSFIGGENPSARRKSHRTVASH
jgi:hypothetical protein